jgi:membrane-associated phospholipid phosphatase
VDRGEPTDDDANGGARFEHERGAVAAASSVILSFLFPNSAATLRQRLLDEEAASGSPDFSLGIADGTTMGNRMVSWAMADRFSAPWAGSVPVGPGLWIANGPPAGPTVGGAATFFLTSGSQFRPPRPPEFNSRKYRASLAEIRTLSDTRTPAQLAIAQFWNFPAGTYTAPGYWTQLAGTYAEEKGLNERQTTRVLALTSMAMTDAVIGCWDAKYYYWFIRPSQADPGITLPIGLPNHPSYPSGHSCNASAAATVLARFFPAHTAELQAQVVEAGLSRMYGGIHYRFDIDAGQKLGRSVANYAMGVAATRGLLFRIP